MFEAALFTNTGALSRPAQVYKSGSHKVTNLSNLLNQIRQSEKCKRSQGASWFSSRAVVSAGAEQSAHPLSGHCV